MPADGEAVAQFLSSNSWPFHNPSAVSIDAAANLRMASDSVESFGSSILLVKMAHVCGG